MYAITAVRATEGNDAQDVGGHGRQMIVSKDVRPNTPEPSQEALVVGLRRAAPADLPTPFVEIDEARLERNMRAMQQRVAAVGARLFPHIKTHKSVVLAEKQLALGASGVTASKPDEALVFVERGVPSVILAYPVVRAETLDRLLPAVRARGTELRVIAASETGIDALSAAATRYGVEIGVFLKVDVGLGRVGVLPDDPAAVALCQRIVASSGLRFAGLLSHAGHSYRARTADERAEIARAEAAMLKTLAAALTECDIAVPCLSIGSTPTCVGAPLPTGITEFRPGNYVFLDGTALRLGICGPEDLALSIVARVIAASGDRFIIDAGSKSLSSDLGPHGTGGAGHGIVVMADEASSSVWAVERLSEEHGFVRAEGRPLPVGTRVRVFPNHACAVMAQFDSVTLRRGDGRSVALRVDARGHQT